VHTGPSLPTAFPDDMPVLSAEIVAWTLEYRCFLLNRRLMTYSLYLRDGRLQRDAGYASAPAEDAALEAFVDTILADETVPLPPAVVMDVGVIEARGWAVVELNAAWGSGLYGCDPTAVLEVLRHAASIA
jgi:ATP-grasp domain, R2K clade family 2